MNELATIRQQLDNLLTYLSFCWDHPIQAPVCRPMWLWITVAIFAVSAAAAIGIIWNIVSYKLKYAAALRAEAERLRVDIDAIEARRWDGDKAYSAELGQEEIDRRIKEAVNARRLNNNAGRDDWNIV